MSKSEHQGFSLLELLIVVAIILIIATIAIPSLLRSRQSAQESSAVAQIRTIRAAPALHAIPAVCRALRFSDSRFLTASFLHSPSTSNLGPQHEAPFFSRRCISFPESQRHPLWTRDNRLFVN